MSKKAVKTKKGEPRAPAGTPPDAESPPSVIREEGPLLPRVIAFVSLLLLTVGSAALLASSIRWNSRVGPGWGTVFFVAGVCGLLYHAAVEKDVQYRRTYGLLGFAWLVGGTVFSVVPVEEQAGALFLPYGAPCFALGLLFFLPFTRNETNAQWREAGVKVLGVIGAVLALCGFVGSNLSADFLLTRGLPLIVLGLLYLWAFVGLKGTGSETGYRAGLMLGAVGGLVFLAALVRSVLPPLLYAWGWQNEPPASFLVPQGLALMVLGLVYFLFGLGICSENQLVVLTRRELASYFYSPIAYIVFFGLAAVGWYRYWNFLERILFFSNPENLFRHNVTVNVDPLIEPVLRWYILDFFTIIGVMFVVPVLTMRLLSEEKRTGTLEVLFTAPAREGNVVLSKFLAAFAVFLLAWLPWVVYLIALRVEGAREFDYRPMLSFFLALFFTGANFIAMGLFFSSLTRNQVAAAILTFVGMLFWTGIYFMVGSLDPGSTLRAVLTHISYVDLWSQAIQGLVIPRSLFFHLSAAVFWLFLTVKVLEARRWS